MIQHCSRAIVWFFLGPAFDRSVFQSTSQISAYSPFLSRPDSLVAVPVGPVSPRWVFALRQGRQGYAWCPSLCFLLGVGGGYLLGSLLISVNRLGFHMSNWEELLLENSFLINYNLGFCFSRSQLASNLQFVILFMIYFGSTVKYATGFRKQ